MAVSMKAVRSLARKVVPESIRPRVKRVVFSVLRPYYAGSAITCPVCKGRFRQLINVGTVASPRYQCPGCGCYDRHRLLALYLDDRDLPAAVGGKRLLHLAPAARIAARFESESGLVYVSGDLGARAADVQLDITALPLRDRSFDLVLCSHVLEHVPADGAAMSELLRTLAPSGTALLQVASSRHAIDPAEELFVCRSRGR